MQRILIAFFVIVVVSSGCHESTTNRTDNLYLYKVMTKIDGVMVPRTTIDHDDRINQFFSKQDDVDPASQIVLSSFQSITTADNFNNKKAWQHGITVGLDPKVFDIGAWKIQYKVSVGCLVYRNKIVGLIFFGPEWKGNSVNISIAADKEGMNYLKGILLAIK